MARRLGAIMVDMGYLDEDTLWKVLEEQKRSGAEQSYPAERARQARHPQPLGVHPFDPVSHLPPELGVQAKRGLDYADGHSRRSGDAETIGIARRLARTP